MLLYIGSTKIKKQSRFTPKFQNAVGTLFYYVSSFAEQKAFKYKLYSKTLIANTKGLFTLADSDSFLSP